MMTVQRTERQKAIDLAYKRYVTAGMAFLEEHYGKEWADLGEEEWSKLFDIRSADHCVLGGIAKGLPGASPRDNYHSLVAKHELDEEDWRYGFITPPLRERPSISVEEGEEESYYEEEIWSSLQRLWMEAFAEKGVKANSVEANG